MSELRKVKVLITGPVCGSFRVLQNKLKSLQSSKAGPFDLCLCVGPFFSASTCTTEDGEGALLNMMRHGLPIPVYFSHMGELPNHVTLPEEYHSSKESYLLVGDSHSKTKQESTSTPPGVIPLAPNVFHLRGQRKDGMSSSQTADIVNIYLDEKFYLTVAFLPPNVRSNSEQTVFIEEKIYHPSYVGCDLLISSEWGQGMASSEAISDPDKVHILGTSSSSSANLKIDDPQDFLSKLSEVGSFDVAELVSQIRPRYHFAPATTISSSHSHFEGDVSSFYFIQSHPYTNPKSPLESGLLKTYHISRFLALCPVVEMGEGNKMDTKTHKCIHALGLQPLWTMDRATATSIPEGGIVVPCPYTDEGYVKLDREEQRRKLNITSNGSNRSTRNDGLNLGSVGLSEAQTRRILTEEVTGVYSNTAIAGNQQFRWNMTSSRKRPVDLTDPQQVTAALDINNKTLFLHGIHHDASGGSLLNHDTILHACQMYNCVQVRYPSSTTCGNTLKKLKSFCFLDFASHEDAANCLNVTSGEIVISGIHLTLKWSSGKSASNFVHPIPPPPPLIQNSFRIPPPPPPSGSAGLYPVQKSLPKRQKRDRLTEAEAFDSETLFVYLSPKQTSSSDRASLLLSQLAVFAQTVMEDAMTAEGSEGSHITAETEPALRVSSRLSSTSNTFGFLDFASHDAANMVLASWTGSTDGGDLQISALTGVRFQGEFADFDGLQLWWSPNPRKLTEQGKTARSSLDARTDCWFCLASPTCERHLILSVFDTCYVTMPKGPLNDYHALIVPLDHVGRKAEPQKNENSSIEYENEDKNEEEVLCGIYSSQHQKMLQEVEDVKLKLRQHAKDVLGKDMFVFERAFPTQRGYHAHINCVPIESCLGPPLERAMFDLAESTGSGFQFREITEGDIVTELANVRMQYGAIRGYFYAEMPNCTCSEIKRFVCIDLVNKSGENLGNIVHDSIERAALVPIQFGREVMAKLLLMHNIGNWKNCILSKDKEDDVANQYRKSLMKYL